MFAFNACRTEDSKNEEINNVPFSERTSLANLVGNVSKTGKSSSEEAYHSVMLKDNFLYEYINENLIAKIPVEISDNKVQINYPKNGQNSVAVLTLDENGNLVNELGIVFYKNESLELKNQTKGTTQKSTDPWCEMACKATHRLLGIPTWVDSICCFWEPVG